MRVTKPQTSKEAVKIRRRKLADGSTRLYFDIYFGHGERRYEFLGNDLSLVPERTPTDKRRNKEVWRMVKALQAERTLDLASGKTGIIRQNKTLDSVIEEYEQRKATGANSDARFKTVKYTEQHLRKYLEKRFETVRLDAIDITFCERFIKYLSNAVNLQNKRPLKKSTAALYYSAFVSVLNYAVRRKYLIANPATSVGTDIKKLIRNDSDPRVFLTAEELQQLKDTPISNSEVRRAFLFSCATGLRLSDVINLKWSNVKEDAIQIRMKKTGDNIVIPLGMAASRELGERGKANDYVFNLINKKIADITQLVTRWGKRAGLTKHISFHTARHTFATLVLPQSDIYTVSKLLGHKSIKTTQIYAEVLDESKRKAINAIDSLGI